MLIFDGLEKFQMFVFLDYKNDECDFQINPVQEKRFQKNSMYV